MAVVRYRDKNADIGRKHGNTLMRTLRETYGLGFAPGSADHAKLSDVLTKLDEPSLTNTRSRSRDARRDLSLALGSELGAREAPLG